MTQELAEAIIAGAFAKNSLPDLAVTKTYTVENWDGSRETICLLNLFTESGHAAALIQFENGVQQTCDYHYLKSLVVR